MGSKQQGSSLGFEAVPVTLLNSCQTKPEKWKN